jgi:hypothetical protein
LGFGPIEKLTEDKAKAVSSKIIASFNPSLVATLLQSPLK